MSLSKTAQIRDSDDLLCIQVYLTVQLMQAKREASSGCPFLKVKASQKQHMKVCGMLVALPHHAK